MTIIQSAFIDDRLPFVHTIKGMISGQDIIENEVAILKDAEARSGAELLVSEHQLGGGLFLPRDRAKHLPLADLLQAIRTRETTLQVYIPAHVLSDDQEDIEQRQIAVVNLFRLTNCILMGLDFDCDGFFIRYPDGALSSFTGRIWAKLLARWADEAPHISDSHNYAFFYLHIDQLIVGYPSWRRAIKEVVQAKLRATT